MKTLSSVIAVAICLIYFPITAFAYDNGITGRTTSGCGGSGCHSGTQTATTLTMLGSTTVLPGSTTVLTLLLQNAARPRSGCDIDFVNSSGTKISGLSAISGQGLSLQSSELTHTSPKAIVGGQSSWQFNLNAPTTMGQYTIRVAGNATTSQSSGDFRMITQNIIVKGLSLTSPAGGQSFCAGNTVNLQWNAFGVSSIQVQLSTDGGTNYTTVTAATSINGANTTSFVLPAATPPGSAYRVRIVDAANAALSSATSSNCTVIAPVVISTQPQPSTLNACEGQVVSFSVVASGVSPTYQWRKDGQNLAGQTSSQFSIASVNPTHIGVYDCTVSSSCGATLTSSTVTLGVSAAASISIQPVPLNVCAGQPASFTVSAVGSALSYQWTKNTQPLPGATQSTFTISTTALIDTAYYACVVNSSCGNPMTSNSAQLSVMTAPVLTQHPESQSLCEDATLTLNSNVALPAGISYQWLRNGLLVNNDAHISGANSNVLVISPLTPADAGVYAIRASAVLCNLSIQSRDAIVVVQPKTRISVQPQPRSALRNADVTFNVTATGLSLRYQWMFNGAAIGGATGATHTITKLQKSHEGAYSVTVTGDCGSASSTAAQLVVMDNALPVISVDQSTVANGNIRVGADRTMNVVVSNIGTATLNVTAMSLGGSGKSAFVLDLTPFSLNPTEQKNISIRFHPQAAMPFNATLSLTSNGGTLAPLNLSGTGIEHALDPGTVFMPTVGFGASMDTTVMLCNRSSIEVFIDTARFTGNAAAFSYASTPLPQLLPLRIGADSCYALSLRFKPTMQGFNSATLQLSTSQGLETIMMNGTGGDAVSVTDDVEGTLHIQPNPVANSLQVRLGDLRGVATLRIASSIGTFERVIENVQDGAIISVESLCNGVYTCIVEDAQRVRMLRFVVLHD